MHREPLVFASRILRLKAFATKPCSSLRSYCLRSKHKPPCLSYFCVLGTKYPMQLKGRFILSPHFGTFGPSGHLGRDTTVQMVASRKQRRNPSNCLPFFFMFFSFLLPHLEGQCHPCLGSHREASVTLIEGISPYLSCRPLQSRYRHEPEPHTSPR